MARQVQSLGEDTLTIRPAASHLRGKQIERVRQFGILLGLVLVYGIFELLDHDFLSSGNVTQIALQSSINAVIAVGMTLVIITAGIDLSVGATAGLAGVIAANLMVNHGLNPVLALALAALVGVVGGVINGSAVAWLRLAPFIVTLGTMSAYRGAALVYTNGEPTYGMPQAVINVFAGTLGPVPTPVIIALIIAVLAHLLLRFTAAGEHIVAVGGNEEAARLSGVPIAQIKLLVYAISGLLAAIGGFITVARINAAEPIAGNGYELDAIAAAAIGGASLFGGRGSIVGTLIGALILGGLRNGLTLLNVSSYWQLVATGIVLIAAVLIDRVTRGRD